MLPILFKPIEHILILPHVFLFLHHTTYPFFLNVLQTHPPYSLPATHTSFIHSIFIYLLFFNSHGIYVHDSLTLFQHLSLKSTFHQAHSPLPPTIHAINNTHTHNSIISKAMHHLSYLVHTKPISLPPHSFIPIFFQAHHTYSSILVLHAYFIPILQFSHTHLHAYTYHPSSIPPCISPHFSLYIQAYLFSLIPPMSSPP